MTYGKLNNGKLVHAPNAIRLNGKLIINPKAEKLQKAGYLPITYTQSPEVEDGYYVKDYYEQSNGVIFQRWTIEKIPEENL